MLRKDCCLVTQLCLFVTPGTVAHQAPLFMGFPRQECWSGLPFLPPGDLPDLGVKPASSAWLANSFPLSLQGSPTEPAL